MSTFPPARAVVSLLVSGLAAVGVALAPALTGRLAPTVEPVQPLVAPAVAPAPPAPPSGPVHATVTPDRETVFLGGDRQYHLRVELTADALDVRAERVPTDLVVVVDRSGSMSGQKIEDARTAAHALVEQLGAEDRFALVSFSGDARLDVPLEARPLGDRRAWDLAVDALSAGGSTAMHEGLTAADRAVGAHVPGRSRRVVLVSDGIPDRKDLLDGLAERFAADETPLTTVGIGDDFDETLMRRLADRGTGNFHWAGRGESLRELLADELSTAHETVASQVVLTVPGARIVDADGLPLERGAVSLGSLFDAQRRVVWLTLEVPESAGESFDPGAVEIRYRDPQGGTHLAAADVPAVSTTRDVAAFASSLGDAWATAVVANEWNDARTEVAAALRDNDQARAQLTLDRYAERNRLLNGWAHNAIVDDNLAEVEVLKQQVAQQFEGEDQDVRRNAFAKETCLDSYKEQRAGSSKDNPLVSTR